MLTKHRRYFRQYRSNDWHYADSGYGGTSNAEILAGRINSDAESKCCSTLDFAESD